MRRAGASLLVIGLGLTAASAGAFAAEAKHPHRHHASPPHGVQTRAARPAPSPDTAAVTPPPTATLTSVDAARQQAADAEQARAALLDARRAAGARADAAAAAEKRLGEQRAVAAAKLRDSEAATQEAAQRMDGLTRDRQEAEAKLAARADDLAPMLPLIERLSLYPAETMLVVPTSTENAVRGILVLQGIAHDIEDQAEALRTEQDALNARLSDVQAEAPKLASAEALQSARAADLDRQISAAQASRRAAEGEAAQAARRAAEQAARAGTLRDVITQLEAAQRAADAKAQADAARQAREEQAAARRAAEAARKGKGGTAVATAVPPPTARAAPGRPPVRGQLATPVIGTVIRSWGDTTDAGPSLGLSYRAAPRAHVASPCNGRVAFAAPFRSYGLLLIVDCGGGYHFVLAGMERTDVDVGDPVQAGEPVGIMPAWDPRTPGDRPSLYVEMRRGGQPVNPAPWLQGRG